MCINATLYGTWHTTADQIDKVLAEYLPDEQARRFQDHFEILGRLNKSQTRAVEPSKLVGSQQGTNHGGPRVV